MKKTVSVLIALLMLSGAVGCGQSDGPQITDDTESTAQITTEEETEMPEVTNEIIEAPDEDTGLSVWYAHSFTKTDPEKPEDTGLRSYTVYMTKGEVENAQIVISSQDEKKRAFRHLHAAEK